MTEVTVHS